MSAFADHFSTLATNYANYRPSYPAELFEYLASVSPARDKAWDCACGNGQASVDLAKHFAQVIATDASAEQIASARNAPKIDYRVAPAEASGLPDASFDLITVAQAMHWFNIDQFYAEARRVLKPRGVVAVWTYGVSQIDQPTSDELFQDFYSNVIGPYWPPERRIVEEGYRTLSFPFEEFQPPKFQMITRWTLRELLGYLSTWSGVKRFRESRGFDPLEQLEAQMLLTWGNPDLARTIYWPLSMRIGRV